MYEASNPIRLGAKGNMSTARGYRSADRALLTQAWASPYVFPVSRPWSIQAPTANVEHALRDPASTRAIILDGGAALALYRAFDWVEQRCALSISPARESATPDQLADWLIEATDIAWSEWNIVRVYGEMSSEQSVARAALTRTPWQVEATVPACLVAWPGQAAADLLYAGALRPDAPRPVATRSIEPLPTQGASLAARHRTSPAASLERDWSFEVLERRTAAQVANWFQDPTFFFTTSRPDLLTEAAIRHNLLEHPGRRCYVALRHQTPVALGHVDWLPARRIVGVDFKCAPALARQPELEPPDAYVMLSEFLRLVERLYNPRALVRESVRVDVAGNALFAAHGFAYHGRRLGHIYRHNQRHDVFVSVRAPQESY